MSVIIAGADRRPAAFVATTMKRCRPRRSFRLESWNRKRPCWPAVVGRVGRLRAADALLVTFVAFTEVAPSAATETVSWVGQSFLRLQTFPTGGLTSSITGSGTGVGVGVGVGVGLGVGVVVGLGVGVGVGVGLGVGVGVGLGVGAGVVVHAAV